MVRIVVENARVDGRSELAELFADAGLDVDLCGGPADFDDHICPVVESGRCPLVERADAVLFDLPLDRAEHRAVLAGLRSHHPDVPVIVEATVDTLRREAELLAGCDVVVPFDGRRLRSAVAKAAIGGR